METQSETLTKWGLDTAHSEVLFKVKHLVITTVTGKFSKFGGTVESDSSDFDGAKVNFEIDTESIDTNNADRDKHLRSDDFFGVEKYPKMVFKGQLNKSNEGYKLNGDLSIRDVTRNLTLDVDFNGTVKDPWGNQKAGFELSGKLNRKDFGLNWNAITEAGGMLVGEEVKLQMSIQLAQV